MKAQILVVDDEPGIRDVLQDVLEDEGHSVRTCADAANAREAYSSKRYDLVLLDIWMPDVDGISLLKEWSEAGKLVPVIMISGHGTVETAVEAIQIGAYDFLEKPLSTAKLLVTINRALKSSAQEQEIASLRHQLEPVSSLIGHSDRMRQLRGQVERIGATQSWVMVYGPPGSGKGVAARAIHQASTRKDGPFVEISLAAIPPENIARRLFGSEEEGQIQAGCFEQAEGGTLLLDEIGDLDAEMQTRLLSALQAGRFLRVGGTEPRSVNIRIISSSNQDIERLVAEGKFREDLYYRLNVMPLMVAPLRDHLDDIPSLVEYYVDWYVQSESLPYRRLGSAAVNRLRQHSWPGSVRELRNLVQRLLIIGGKEEVSAEEIETMLADRQVSPASAEPQAISGQFNTDLRTARDHFEKTYFEYHLQALGGNVSALAQVSGLERTHLYRKLKALDINPKDWKL